LYRQINDSGHICEVVSPAHTPRRPGDHVKTDRRDALVLARLSRAGELTTVWVPDAAHEAMRDLIRSREAASKDVRQARQRIQGFLLRHGRRYVGAVWKKRHRVWLGNQTFEHAAQQIAFQTYLNAMDQASERKVAIEREIEALLPKWSLGPVVEALQALRGVASLSRQAWLQRSVTCGGSTVRANSWPISVLCQVSIQAEKRAGLPASRRPAASWRAG
jgi:transposase